MTPALEHYPNVFPRLLLFVAAAKQPIAVCRREDLISKNASVRSYPTSSGGPVVRYGERKSHVRPSRRRQTAALHPERFRRFLRVGMVVC